MERQRNPNIEILTMAVSKLGPVADEMVFLGGCATGLLITDPAAPPVGSRQTLMSSLRWLPWENTINWQKGCVRGVL